MGPKVSSAIARLPPVLAANPKCRYSIKPLKRRFGAWSYVPTGMAQYAQDKGLAEVWADVLEIVKKHCQGEAGTSAAPLARPFKPRILTDRPLYGAPLVEAAMGFSPVNEMGVVFLFGVAPGGFAARPRRSASVRKWDNVSLRIAVGAVQVIASREDYVRTNRCRPTQYLSG